MRAEEPRRLHKFSVLPRVELAVPDHSEQSHFRFGCRADEDRSIVIYEF